jgi:hypothetical protein
MNILLGYQEWNISLLSSAFDGAHTKKRVWNVWNQKVWQTETQKVIFIVIEIDIIMR